MKNPPRFQLIQGFALLLILSACTRTTVVSGRITNVRTNNPVVGMPVALIAYNGHDPRDSATPKKVGQSSTSTNADGTYALEYAGTGIDEVALQLDGGNLCTSYFEVYYSDYVKPNVSQQIDIQIDSIDGKIQLILQNQSGQSDKLFLRVDCDATGDKGIYCCNLNFENTIPVGQTDTLMFNISGDRFVPVYWSESVFSGWNAPHIDSVFCPRHQVTPLAISF